MGGYLLPVSCPSCGGTVEHVTSGRPVARTECSALGRCVACGRGWQVIVHLRPCIDPASEKRRAWNRAKAAAS